MPNWTNNTVIITGEKPVLKKLKDFLQSEDSIFDFNKIVPMPETLDLESGGIMSNAMQLAKAKNAPKSAAYKKAKANLRLPYTMYQVPKGYPEVLTTEEDVITIGQLYLDNQEKYGAATWFDWHCNNWGTKWNACSPELESENDTELVYGFDTAWSQPDAVLLALSTQYPDITIKLQSIYEDDMPYNVYVSEFHNGEASDSGICVDEDRKAEYDADNKEEE